MNGTFTSATNGTDAAGAPARSRLSFDLDVDICVVGAGLAGLTVALEAARLGASVAVLEGRHVGWNASGHQLGTVMPGYGLAIGELIARIGLEDARELWALSKEGAEYVRANAT
ncbi:MAG: FAD-dependent oxidoreductase, partial [Bradyrhizobium sp.]|nr:FAD-dependent oxidoreductase [Bradyrhizobium sp.]